MIWTMLMRMMSLILRSGRRDEDEETVQRRKDLAMRMEGLNIEEADFEEIWERLDAREREEFVRLAQELEKEDHTNPLLDD